MIGADTTGRVGTACRCGGEAVTNRLGPGPIQSNRARDRFRFFRHRAFATDRNRATDVAQIAIETFCTAGPTLRVREFPSRFRSRSGKSNCFWRCSAFLSHGCCGWRRSFSSGKAKAVRKPRTAAGNPFPDQECAPRIRREKRLTAAVERPRTK